MKGFTLPIILLFVSISIGILLFVGASSKKSVPSRPDPTPDQYKAQNEALKSGLAEIERCGDLPQELMPVVQHYSEVIGKDWSPDCKHIAWSIFNSGTSVVNPVGTGTIAKGAAEEGVFVLSIETKKTTKLQIPEKYTSPFYEKWKDDNSIIFSTAVGEGPETHSEYFIYDINSNSFHPSSKFQQNH